jgi:hypothetical protein
MLMQLDQAACSKVVAVWVGGWGVGVGGGRWGKSVRFGAQPIPSSLS